MPRRRYVSTEISVDRAVNRLGSEDGDFAALLYTWMIPHAEDDGTLAGDPEEMLYRIVPGRRDKSVDDVVAALSGMERLGLITWISAKRLRITGWDQHAGVSPERTQWNSLRRKVAPHILHRDGRRCAQCGATDDLTVDHIIPLAHGGSNDAANLRTLCRSCNSRKGAR